MDVSLTFRHRPHRHRTAGVTLVEMMVALAVLALGVVALMTGFTTLNASAASSRLAVSAKALCQERIEQVITQPFHPPAQLTTVKGAPPNPDFNLMGTAANWTTAAGPYTDSSPFSFQGVGAVQTSQDTVNVCVQQDGVTTSVSGVRTTTMSVPDSTNSPDLALFTVTLTYSYRGRTFSTTMSTLRAVD